MYRFFNTEKVSEEDLISACVERTSLVCKGRHVLVLNNTSEINLDSHIKYQGKTEKLKNPHKESTLNWATWIKAIPGSWPGYHSQRPPGPIPLKMGLTNLIASSKDG